MKIVHDPKHQQINFLDERFYTLDNTTFFPGVTTILEAYPKGFGYTQWLKDMGINSDEVMKRAGEVGSHVHDAIDQYLLGNELKWANTDGSPIYSTEEWLMILKFVEFHQTYKPEIIAHEISLVSPKLQFGGTLDLICAIDKNIWLIDYKTTNAVYKTHELQLSAYCQLWNENHPDQHISRWGIMHLKSLTRDTSKNGLTLQGKGWKIVEYERHYNDAFRLFEHTHQIWLEENPNYKPKNMTYPDTIQLKRGDNT